MIEMKPKVRHESVPQARLADPESANTNVVVRPDVPFDSVKVFAATKFTDRAVLGELVTDWIAKHPQHQITEIAVRQSSDSEFHCLSLIVFYRGAA